MVGRKPNETEVHQCNKKGYDINFIHNKSISLVQINRKYHISDGKNQKWALEDFEDSPTHLKIHLIFAHRSLEEIEFIDPVLNSESKYQTDSP